MLCERERISLDTVPPLSSTASGSDQFREPNIMQVCTKMQYLAREISWDDTPGPLWWEGRARLHHKLPPPLRRVYSPDTFKRQLKTFLYNHAFNLH